MASPERVYRHTGYGFMEVLSNAMWDPMAKVMVPKPHVYNRGWQGIRVSHLQTTHPLAHALLELDDTPASNLALANTALRGVFSGEIADIWKGGTSVPVSEPKRRTATISGVWESVWAAERALNTNPPGLIRILHAAMVPNICTALTFANTFGPLKQGDNGRVVRPATIERWRLKLREFCEERAIAVP